MSRPSSSAAHFYSDWNWGSVPEWLGAGGTVLAFGLALLIYWGNYRETRRQQARLVSVLITREPELVDSAPVELRDLASPLPSTVTREGSSRYQVGSPTLLWHLSAHNMSQETIWTLRVELLDATGEPIAGEANFPALGPASTTCFSMFTSPAPVEGSGPSVKFRFVDAAGHQWIRRPEKAVELRRLWLH